MVKFYNIYSPLAQCCVTTNIGNWMGICHVGIGPTVGQCCVPNTNGPIIAQRWSSTGPTYVFTQCQRTNNYPTLPNVCRTSEQALVKMVSSSTIYELRECSEFAREADRCIHIQCFKTFFVCLLFIYNYLMYILCIISLFWTVELKYTSSLFYQ